LHTVIYILGILIFLALFLIQRITHVISGLTNKIVKYFTKKALFIEEFSSNLLSEITYDDLQMEYSQTLAYLNKANFYKNDESLKDS